MAATSQGLTEGIEKYLEKVHLSRLDETVQAMKRDHPILDMIEMREGLGGDNVHTLMLTPATAPAASVGGALRNRQPSRHERMTITPKQYVMAGSWKRRDLRQTQDKFQAVANALDTEMKSLKNRMRGMLSALIWGDAGGSLGRLSARATDGTETKCTFENASDAHKIEAGDTVQFSDVDGTGAGSVRAGGTANTENTLLVTRVDRQNGIFWLNELYTDATDGIPTLANTDYVFLDEIFQNGMSGFFGWMPNTVTSTLFNGIDRTARDFQRAAGARINGQGVRVKDALESLVVETDLYGAGGNRVLCVSRNTWLKVSRDLDSRLIVEHKKRDGVVGVRGIQFMPDVPLIWDRHVPDNKAALLTLDDWALRSVGTLLHHVENSNGGPLHYLGAHGSNEDAIAFLLALDADLVCDAPERSGVCYNLGVA